MNFDEDIIEENNTNLCEKLENKVYNKDNF